MFYILMYIVFTFGGEADILFEDILVMHPLPFFTQENEKVYVVTFILWKTMNNNMCIYIVALNQNTF